MKCSKCNQLLGNGAFCPNCGEKQQLSNNINKLKNFLESKIDFKYFLIILCIFALFLLLTTSSIDNSARKNIDRYFITRVDENFIVILDKSTGLTWKYSDYDNIWEKIEYANGEEP